MRVIAVLVATIASVALAAPFERSIVKDAEGITKEPRDGSTDLDSLSLAKAHRATREESPIDNLLPDLNLVKRKESKASGLSSIISSLTSGLGKRQLGNTTDIITGLTGGLKERETVDTPDLATKTIPDLVDDAGARKSDILDEISSPTDDQYKRQLGGLTKPIDGLTGGLKERQLNDLTKITGGLTGGLKERQLSGISSLLSGSTGKSPVKERQLDSISPMKKGSKSQDGSGKKNPSNGGLLGGLLKGLSVRGFAGLTGTSLVKERQLDSLSSLTKGLPVGGKSQDGSNKKKPSNHGLLGGILK